MAHRIDTREAAAPPPDSGQANGPLIDAEHVSMTFPAQRALDDVSLQIESGEVHALLGEEWLGEINTD